MIVRNIEEQISYFSRVQVYVGRGIIDKMERLNLSVGDLAESIYKNLGFGNVCSARSYISKVRRGSFGRAPARDTRRQESVFLRGGVTKGIGFSPRDSERIRIILRYLNQQKRSFKQIKV